MLATSKPFHIVKSSRVKPTTDVTSDVLELAQPLIAIPSRAGIDNVEPILTFVEEWCSSHGMSARVLEDGGRAVGIVLTLSSGPGPSLCLNACLDTAPFGDEAKWRNPPTSGVIERGRLLGRGAADSKTAAAMFLLLGSELARTSPLTGTLHVLLDADEHTGEFRGVKQFIRNATVLPRAAWIGYPGNHTIVAGSRGFLRGRVYVAGLAAHTGSKRKKGINAISRAATAIALLEAAQLPSETDPEFSFGPSLSVTAIHAGEGFSVVPDLCEINLDMRLTPSVDAERLTDLVERTLQEFDRISNGPGDTRVKWEESWPAFRVPDGDRAIACLLAAAEPIFGRAIPTTVSGPSNIGNYLAAIGIPAMAGFGVTYDNVHAADEWCEIASIRPVYETYRTAVLSYLIGSG